MRGTLVRRRAGPATPGSDPLLRIRGLRKRFGGTLALAGIDLDLCGGSILALLGENGAGKSTLIQILAGAHRADEGWVTVAGHPLGTDAATRMMAFIHQDLGLVESMTVAENVALVVGYPRRIGLISWRRTRDRCQAALRAVSADVGPGARVADLTRAERSLIAVARALATDAEVVILDEPTAGLPAADCARLFDVLRRLRDQGHGIMYVTHRLDEVEALADTFAILRDGRLVGQGRLTEGRAARLVTDIAGHECEDRRHLAGDTGVPVLTLTDVRTARAGPVSLRVCAGEVVGLVGLTGAGHTEIGRAAAGACPIFAGQVHLDGTPVRLRSVATAVDAGIGLVTGDRPGECSAPQLSVRENLLANPRIRGLSPMTWMGPRRERAESSRLLRRFGVRPPDPEAPFGTLSGGNQQKVVLGRWLGAERRVLVLEDPTAGVDAGARAEIYRLLEEARAKGTAVLLVSTDVNEVVRLCHRVLVVVRGVITVELPGEDLTAAAVVQAMSAGPSQGTPERR
ncbi:sugar ABC transporter ATP-binding protein [Actinoallomurus rhizosphaericola]|uniref:sugar ABC transporter ATP-binding protein n=1 Tax=Actinoallomurus rhizosphaericola TaxID=2952536 RepID=UPI002092ADF5|nr:ATP-binding cassette domain-containing protein [Actinoallomurus rhizosphaericola]MCO5997372.1 sugar ABC transporter ATP-binding protein [Actinoallomurus rhizosphaericola]